MRTILDEITDNKRIEVAAARNKFPLRDLKRKLGGCPPVRDFYRTLKPEGNLRIIAEIKRASPSKGVFREDFDPVSIARSYRDGGASALSVLTDEKYFKGSLDYLGNIRSEVDIPLLRKDFIVDEYQVYESRLYGADALLLIVSSLEKRLLGDLLDLTHSLGMNAIVEVHDEDELSAALDAGCRIVGINNRDLKTFEVDLSVSRELAKMVPSEIVVVAESGIRDSRDIKRLRESGVHAFLIGETFMKAPSPGLMLNELIAASS